MSLELDALVDVLADRIATRVSELVRDSPRTGPPDAAAAVVDHVLGEAAGRAFLSIPQAGQLLAGLGRSGSYDAAKRGELGPVLEVGGRKVIPVPALVALLLGQQPERTPRLQAVAGGQADA